MPGRSSVRNVESHYRRSSKRLLQLNKKRTLAISSCLLLVAIGIIIPLAQAVTGDFYLGSSTMSKKIWSSSSPSHIQVTVTVTSAMADTYADTQPSSVTVKTDNQEVTLHNGETQTIEDAATSSVMLYENAGMDHNYHSYYGISGTWEVTVQSDDGEGLGLTNALEGGEWIVVGIATVAFLAIALIVYVVVVRKRNPIQKQAAVSVPGNFCTKCGAQNNAEATYCEKCGSQLSK
jgi:hypothetical protein